MLGKISKKQVNYHFNRVKHFLGNAYNNSKQSLGDIDTGVKTFFLKNIYIYSIVAPVLDSYGINGVGNNYINTALTGYDNIRNNVIHHHDKVMNDIKYS